MGSFVAKDVALLLRTPPSSALCLVTRVVEHACILSWHCSVANAQVIRTFSFVYTYYCFLFVFWNNAVQTRMFETVRHCQVEMFVSVYANVHYHRYLGPRVAGGSILATSAAMLLLAATITPRLPHCDLRGQFCTYFHQDKFYLRQTCYISFFFESFSS